MNIENDVEGKSGAENVAGDVLGRVNAHVRGGLERFNQLVEGRGEETGAWCGEVQDGEARRGRARSRLDPATFELFRRLSATRGRRIFHPRAAAYAARFTAERGEGGAPAEVFVDGFAHDAFVRLSRGLGLRPPLPDIFGLALRLPDVYGPGRHQDFLLASSGEGVVGRRLLRPTLGGRTGMYSSLLPYDLGGRRLLVGARPAAEPTDAFDLLVAPLRGPWRVAARLTLGSRLEEAVARELRFDPWNSGGGLIPAGVVNRVRGAAYRGSRRGSAV
jgi:hypothetical protein